MIRAQDRIRIRILQQELSIAVQVCGLRVIRIEYAAIHGLYAVQVCSAGHAFRGRVQLSVI